MAKDEHLEILRQGVDAWNYWREGNKGVNPDLSEASLKNADLYEANLSHVDLYGANLSHADLIRADLTDATLCSANLNYSNLYKAVLSDADITDATLNNANLGEANLIGADFSGAILIGTNLSLADLKGARLHCANLTKANFTKADLSHVDLSGANLIETRLTQSTISDCKIYGISAWNLDVDSAIQRDLIVSHDDEPVITVDNLEVAQFVYLLLHNEKIRHVIDTITTKAVLILGRFTEDRKAVLNAIREELRQCDYIPILFDFEKPNNRDLTETVMTLFSLARFVIADLSEPHSIPQELMALSEKMPSVPVQPIFCPTLESPRPYPLFEHFLRYQHVLDICPYDNQDNLIAMLPDRIIAPAEAKTMEMKPRKLW